MCSRSCSSKTTSLTFAETPISSVTSYSGHSLLNRMEKRRILDGTEHQECGGNGPYAARQPAPNSSEKRWQSPVTMRGNMAMIAIDTRRIRTEKFSFVPTGKDVWDTKKPTQRLIPSDVLWSARIFLATRESGRKADELSALFKFLHARFQQNAKTSNWTCRATEGIYAEPGRGLMEMDGWQIFVLGIGANGKKFDETITTICEDLAEHLEVPHLYAQVQRNGISKWIWQITPRVETTAGDEEGSVSMGETA